MCERRSPKPFVQLGIEAHDAFLQDKRLPDMSYCSTDLEAAHASPTALLLDT